MASFIEDIFHSEQVADTDNSDSYGASLSSLSLSQSVVYLLLVSVVRAESIILWCLGTTFQIIWSNKLKCFVTIEAFALQVIHLVLLCWVNKEELVLLFSEYLKLTILNYVYLFWDITLLKDKLTTFNIFFCE